MPEFTVENILEFQRLIDFVRRRLSSDGMEAAASQEKFEQELREHTMALERAVHRADLSRLDLDVEGIIVDGQRFRRSHRSEGTVLTMAGPVGFERTVYRQRGGHGGECIGVVEARIGAVEGQTTLAAARLITAFVSSVPPAEVEMLLKEVGGVCPSRSTLDRIPKAVSAQWEQARSNNEDRVRILEAANLPDRADVKVLVFSLDGVMVRMKDAPNTPGAGREHEGAKGHREAASGTVALYDADGNRLHTVYLGRMPESKKVALHEQLLQELRWMLTRYPNAQVVALADGAQENWRIMREIEAALKISAIHLTDYYHAAQHLEEGLQAAGLSAKVIASWKHRLLQSEKGPAECLDELSNRLARTSPRSKKRLLALQAQVTYFTNNHERMRYVWAEARNIPVGSGVQEAACKTLVVQRMKCSGMSWLTAGGQAILTLRSLQHSDRFGAAWDVLNSRFRPRIDIDTD